MGTKNRGKKRKREEKAKVKFKVGKTLPKGHNVTDLKFKTKRIVMPEQLKEAEVGAIVSRKRKTLKELMSMLTNFNSKARQEALEGLGEISKSNFSEISTNSVLVLNKVAPVCADKESKVRRLAVRTLKEILARSDLVQLRSSSRALAANMSSSMTHVVPEIRSDSLEFMDAVLETHPSLLFTDSERVLKDFLAQIAAPLKGEAGAKTGGVDWFVRVLSRLKLFFQGFQEQFFGKAVSSVITKTFDRKRPIFVDLASIHRANETSEGTVLSNDFVTSLLPLLLTVGTEVVEKDNTLSLEKAEAAVCVAEILCLIHKSSPTSIPDEWGDRIRQTFRNFPFEVNPPAVVHGKKTKKSKSEGSEEGSVLKASSAAVKLNLLLTYVFSSFGVLGFTGKLRSRVLNWITELLREESWLGLCTSGDLCDALRALMKVSPDTNDEILRIVCSAACSLHPLKRERMDLSKLLIECYEDVYTKNREVCPELKEWAAKTIGLLEEDVIHQELFPILLTFCKLGDPKLSSSLTKSMKDLCKNLPKKSIHRSTWPSVATHVRNLMSWCRIDESSFKHDEMLTSSLPHSVMATE